MNKLAASHLIKAAAIWLHENAELTMCERCVEIDKKIEHYRFMASRMTDQPTLDGIKKLIEDMKAERTALHPEQGQ
jgi:hypothetical protein